MSLRDTDEAAAAVATAPRVSLKDIEANIEYRYDLNAGAAVGNGAYIDADAIAKSLNVLSICILVMRNGFSVIGKSAPASEENFDADLGKRFAYEDAVRQLWPLMGYALRDRLWRDSYDAVKFHEATAETDDETIY